MSEDERPRAEEAAGRPDRPVDQRWPRGMPYTVYFPDGNGGSRAADLEHPAPLPRVGDTVEYINERGTRERFVVREVVHTLQTSAAARPSVRDEADNAATSVARRDDEPAEQPGDGGELRAGLPKVFLDPASKEQP